MAYNYSSSTHFLFLCPFLPKSCSGGVSPSQSPTCDEPREAPLTNTYPGSKEADPIP